MSLKLRLLIAGLFASAVTIGTDFVGVGAILTPIERSFDVTVATSQWVINAYALAFAMGIVTGGRLGDLFGRRRVLMIGLGAFALASLLNAVSLDIGWLIASRVLQGIGNALLWPTALGLLFASAPAGKSGVYIGVMFGLVGLGNAIGPLIAGAVADIAPWGWRLFFAFNLLTSAVAIGLLLAAGSAGTQELRGDEKVDYAGIATLALGMFGLLYAIDRATSLGWSSPIVVGSLVLCVAALAAFFVIERSVGDPLIPPVMWSNRPFVMSVLLNSLQIVAAFIMFVFVPQIGQKVWGLTSLQSAMLLLPLMLPFAGLAPLAGRLYDRVGPRPLLVLGYGSVTVGSLWLLLVDADAGFWTWLAPAELLVGVGVGVTVGPAGTSAVASVEEKDASLAGGIAFQWHLIAGVLGIAIATFAITSHVSASIRADAAKVGAQLSRAESKLAQGILTDNPDAAELKAKLPPSIAQRLDEQISEAYRDGFQRSFWAAFSTAVIGLGLTWILPRHERATPEAPD